MSPEELRCSNCGRRPAPDENIERWRARSDGIGELHLFCPRCDEREFSADEDTDTS